MVMQYMLIPILSIRTAITIVIIVIIVTDTTTGITDTKAMVTRSVTLSIPANIGTIIQDTDITTSQTVINMNIVPMAIEYALAMPARKRDSVIFMLRW